MTTLIHRYMLLLWIFTILGRALGFRDHGKGGLSSKFRELGGIQRESHESTQSDDWGNPLARTATENAVAIHNGKPATIGMNPWQAALFRSDDPTQRPFCGGSLISNRHVLTAAHCLFEDEEYLCSCCDVCTRERQFEASEITVRLGMFDWSDTDEASAQNFDIDMMILHEGYESPSDDDIALLRLATEVTFGAHISKIPLTPPETEYYGRMARVTGWGRLEHEGRKPHRLQSVDVEIFDDDECRREWKDEEGRDNRVCAWHKYTDGDICQGDSGGPLSVLNEETGRRELVGVVEAGHCGQPDKARGRYMKVTHYLEWIKIKMEL